MTAVTFTRSIYQWIIDSVYSFKNQANIFFFCRNLFQPDDLRVVFAKGYEQSLFPFRDSEGKEKQASECKIDCGSTGALAFKDVGDFRPCSLVYFARGFPG